MKLMSEREKELKEIADKLEEENRILRQQLEEKRKERRIQERIQSLREEKEDMEYEIENGISRKQKNEQIEKSIPKHPIRPKDIWL